MHVGTGSLQQRNVFEHRAEELQAWVTSAAVTGTWDARAIPVCDPRSG
jgi:hypothetical protein